MNNLDFHKSIINSLCEGVFVTDSKGCIKYHNNQINDLFGYEKNELIGKPIEILIPKTLQKSHETFREDFMSNPKKRPHGLGLDVYAKRKDDTTFPVEVSLSYFRDNNEVFVISLISDITERKNKEQKIQKFIENQISIKNEHVKTQLEVLKNQLSPHYLFNCLNILYSLIDSDKEKALVICKKISETYSYVLKTKDLKLISLQKELGFLKNYIELQKIRFPNKIKFTIQEELDQKNIVVVPLSIQLLVENVFKHNAFIESTTINIELKRSNEHLLIINNKTNKRNGVASYGIGLSNLKKQYSLITNEQVSVKDTKNEFIVRIPLIEKSYD